SPTKRCRREITSEYGIKSGTATRAYRAFNSMALSIGTRLGPYEIVAPIGAGGMGTCMRPT
ncbi:MAG TPA: hypothetical protein VGQ81_14375, partial [Acidobacteriota bacterium]|nr:hypothetical protein [Acidobacteriota bacterium]